MKLYIFFLSVLSSLILIGCGRQDNTASETVNIPFDRAERLSYASLPEDFLGGLEYVTLRPEGQDYLFAEADKVIYRNGPALHNGLDKQEDSFLQGGRAAGNSTAQAGTRPGRISADNRLRRR